jgi:hypothetical protein
MFPEALSLVLSLATKLLIVLDLCVSLHFSPFLFFAFSIVLLILAEASPSLFDLGSPRSSDSIFIPSLRACIFLSFLYYGVHFVPLAFHQELFEVTFL